jgi:NAD(P)-dependent dehydrogenase (short-subunit alcohol dehydrogenase family)
MIGCPPPSPRQVSTPELVEVMFVNAVSPFVLNSRLQPLMVGAGVAARDRYIVNVSAMEGKFYRYKTPNHPHTNMAKAALNMMTRTSAEVRVRRWRRALRASGGLRLVSRLAWCLRIRWFRPGG